jgi:hypothetical protein
MELLETHQLLSAFEKLASKSSQIDIAVGWVTESDALLSLRKAAKRGARVRVVVGLSGNATTPTALRSLLEFADVRIGVCRSGTFHPKFYLFHSTTRSVCWIGSANFTGRAFSYNLELVQESTDSGSAERWFKRLWRGLTSDPLKVIDKYCDEWTPPPQAPGFEVVSRQSIVRSPIELILPPPKTWEKYVAALRLCDAYKKEVHDEFSILGEARSYLETISIGRELCHRRNWSSLTRDEANILLPNQERDGAWGALGSMKGAAKAISLFHSNRGGIRTRIRHILDPAFNAQTQDEFIQHSSEAISRICQIKRFKTAIATRLLALGRPDLGVSVNAGSAPGLSTITGLSKNPRTLGNPSNYKLLLQWLYQQPWYKVGKPADSEGRTLWSMRAALLDAFVFKPSR